jgi:hypothetical protein
MKLGEEGVLRRAKYPAEEGLTWKGDCVPVRGAMECGTGDPILRGRLKTGDPMLRGRWTGEISGLADRLKLNSRSCTKHIPK